MNRLYLFDLERIHAPNPVHGVNPIGCDPLYAADQDQPPPVPSAMAAGVLRHRLRNGLAVDAVVMAGPGWMDDLVSAGVVEGASRRVLARDHLVLVGAEDDGVPPVRLSEGAFLAQELGSRSLVMGDPATTVSGAWGKLALERLAAWPRLQGQLRFETDPRRIPERVADGSAGLGLMLASAAQRSDLVTVVAHVPANILPPLIFEAARLTQPPGDAARQQAATAYLTWLATRPAHIWNALKLTQP